MDSGIERLSDPGLVSSLRRRTLVLVAEALVLAALMTAIAAAATAH